MTDREVEVLEGAALGETAGQTGTRLFLSPETIRSHRKRVSAKLGTRNVTRAVVVAIATGLLNIDRLVDEEDA